MATHYPIVFEREDSGVYSAYVAGLPVYAQGPTRANAASAIVRTLGAYLQAHPQEQPRAEVRVAKVSIPTRGRARSKVSLVTAAALVGSPAAVREPERSPNEAYIETVRCSTCNECTTINSKMFAYDQNRQAYIADVTAGTYAQLVEAAESCQVAVIHPGRPRNPQEPDLEDLLKRAAPFR